MHRGVKAVIVVFVVVVLAAVVFLAGRFIMRMPTDGQSSPTASPGLGSTVPSAVPVSPTPVDLDQVQVGNCVSDAVQLADQLSSLPMVPCDVPHNGEVFAVTDSGVLSDQNFNVTYCQTEFAHYMDSMVGQSKYTFMYVYPPSADNVAHLKLICIVYSAKGATNTGSLEGSGQ